MTNKEFISICIDALLTVVFFVAAYIFFCAAEPFLQLLQGVH
ncbi:MAG: hypothetical protein V8R83_09590 [Candidatus Gastranaerophilaceae bacterium]|nr:MAG TPA: hypothetical protein [Caudoviricetes sp.]